MRARVLAWYLVSKLDPPECADEHRRGKEISASLSGCAAMARAIIRLN